MKKFYIVISSLLVCALLAFIEHGIEINYLIKTGFKIGLFFLVIWTYTQLFKDFRFKHPVSIHKMVKKEWIRVIALGVSSAVIVLLAYILLQPVLDMAKIKKY